MLTLAPKERMLLALDVASVQKAGEIQADLKGLVGPAKLGLEAISADIAHQIADGLAKGGERVFWDGKFKDIPNTVAGAAKGLFQRHPEGIWAFNVHADGGVEMMKAAVDNRGSSLVLAVTLLTSLGDSEADHLYGLSALQTVLKLADDALSAGVQGLICSAQEASALRQDSKFQDLILVTPAIRPDWSVPADQKRPVTPRQAILNGADLVVLGRALTSPEGMSRREAAERVLAEVEQACREKYGS